MAAAPDVQTATQRPSSQTSGHGLGGNVKMHIATVEAAAEAELATSFYSLATLPSTARVMFGFIYWDDLGSSTTSTLDVGVYSTYTGQITDDEDALNSGLDIDAAAGNSLVVADHVNLGKQLWEYVSGVTADPGGDLTIKASIEDASLAAGGGGSITMVLFYILD